MIGKLIFLSVYIFNILYIILIEHFKDKLKAHPKLHNYIITLGLLVSVAPLITLIIIAYRVS